MTVKTTESGLVRHAIVLAGGRSRRMIVDKLELVRGDSTMLATICRSAQIFADRIWVVGPPRKDIDADISFVREDPPFSGPAAGIMAAVRLLPSSGETLILAGDLAHPDEVVDLLTFSSFPSHTNALLLEDEEGWPQFLAGRYRIEALKEIHSSAHHMSVRQLMSRLSYEVIPVSQSLSDDIDTPQKAEKYGFTIR